MAICTLLFSTIKLSHQEIVRGKEQHRESNTHTHKHTRDNQRNLDEYVVIGWKEYKKWNNQTACVKHDTHKSKKQKKRKESDKSRKNYHSMWDKLWLFNLFGEFCWLLKHIGNWLKRWQINLAWNRIANTSVPMSVQYEGNRFSSGQA